MNQILKRLFILGLFIFSFYYTNKVVEHLKEKDPLMSNIKRMESKYKVESMNAEIVDNTMRPGQKGKEIDYDKTYTNMKKYGAYNESLTVLKETIPVISIENYYDKYIIGGNKKKKEIALIFTISEDIDITKIIRILNNKKVTATFFIDGNYLEKNITLLKTNTKYEFELLSYDQEYKEPFFKTALSYLESVTSHTPKYCYTEKENEEFLKLCKKLKLHTVKPTLVLKNNLYKTLKENLSNSMMISFEMNSELTKELPTILDYVKEKGYKLVSLEQLLSE